MTLALVYAFLLANLTVREFKVEGVKSLSKKEISALTRIKRGDRFYPPLVNLSATKIIEGLQSKGFFEAEIIEQKVEERDSFAYILIKIREGPRYKIGSVTISWLSQDTLLKSKVMNILRNEPGGYFDLSKFVENEEKAYELFRNTGYLRAEIEKIVRPDTLQKTCEVFYNINPGPRFRVRSINIEGAQKVRKVIIEREILLKRGQYASSSLVLESIRRIYSTGLFARVYHTYSFYQDSSVTVNFYVEERKNRYIKIQGGIYPFSLINLNLESGYRNIFGNNQTVNARTEISLESFRNITKFYMEGLYTEPYFLSSPLKFNLKLFGGFSKYDSASFLGLETYLSYFWNDRSRSLLGIQWRKFLETREMDGLINKAIFSTILDKRDNIFYPRSGFQTQIEFASAGGFLGGNYDFYKYSFSLSTYRRIWKPNGVLAFRVVGGQIIPIKNSEIPAIEKFKVGGDGTLRAFKFNEFYKDRLTLLNVELRDRIGSRFGLSLLFDLFPEFDGKIWHSFGMGFRYFSPIGPIRVDWCYNPWRFGEKRYFGNVYINLGEMF